MPLLSDCQVYDYRHLDGQNHWDADDEFGMPGFMPEGIHSGKAPQTATDGSDGHEGGLGDSPEFFSGLVLVHQHKQKTCRIDYDEVKKDKLHVNMSFWEG